MGVYLCGIYPRVAHQDCYLLDRHTIPDHVRCEGVTEAVREYVLYTDLITYFAQLCFETGFGHPAFELAHEQRIQIIVSAFNIVLQIHRGNRSEIHIPLFITFATDLNASVLEVYIFFINPNHLAYAASGGKEERQDCLILYVLTASF